MCLKREILELDNLQLFAISRNQKWYIINEPQLMDKVCSTYCSQALIINALYCDFIINTNYNEIGTFLCYYTQTCYVDEKCRNRVFPQKILTYVSPNIDLQNRKSFAWKCQQQTKNLQKCFTNFCSGIHYSKENSFCHSI